MLNSSLYIVASGLVLVLASQAFAAELIELNDANKNLLNLEVGKALETVQAALTNDFKFEHVSDAKNFIAKCNYLKFAMKDEKDDEFEGLAGKIKGLLEDDQLLNRCQIETSQLDEYSLLDEKEEDCFYLSRRRLNGLISLGEKLEKNPEIKQVLGHLYETKTNGTGKQLLDHTTEDTEIFFVEPNDSGYYTTRKYVSGCSISVVKPICKLVRGVAFDDVSAYGRDVVEFGEALKSNNQDVIMRHVQASGVSLEELKSQCQAVKFGLKPIRLVNDYLKAGFLEETQIEEQSEKDSKFHLYYELNNLCELQSHQ